MSVQSVVMFDGGHQSTVVGSVGEVEDRISEWRATEQPENAFGVASSFVYFDTNSGGQVAIDTDRVVAIAGKGGA